MGVVSLCCRGYTTELGCLGAEDIASISSTKVSYFAYRPRREKTGNFSMLNSTEFEFSTVH